MTHHRLDLVAAPHGATKVLLGERCLAAGRGYVIAAALKVMLAEGLAAPDDRVTTYRGEHASMSGHIAMFLQAATAHEGPLRSALAVAGGPEATAGSGTPDD